MKTSALILYLCLAISIGCLGGGYVWGGYWLIVPVFIAMTVIWIMTKKQSGFWSASGLLLSYVALASVGVMIDLSIFMMVLGCTTALACWDLTHFRRNLLDVPSMEKKLVLERYRLHSLAAALLGGLLLALASFYLNLRLPFVVVVFLVLLAVGSITRGLRQNMVDYEKLS